MASSFGLNSFYGGSKGRPDSSSTDSDLNCVKTRRKAGQPPVSQNKGKKAVLAVQQEVTIVSRRKVKARIMTMCH